MPTYRLDIEYDGTDWYGWQIQPDRPTIQQAIEQALTTSLRAPTSIVGSGRTDAGVHAKGQVAHLELDEEIDAFRLTASLNGILPDSIVIHEIRLVGESFHARYDAIERRYGYRINCRPIAIERSFRWYIRPEPDFEAMNRGAALLVGQHDFSAFCRTNSETRNRVCTVRRAEWLPEDQPGNWIFRISADRFLHGMVRSIVGTLMGVGHAKMGSSSMTSILESKNRTEAGLSAPARGLTLDSVIYPRSDTDE